MPHVSSVLVMLVCYMNHVLFHKTFYHSVEKMAPDKDTRLPYGTIFVTLNLHGCTHNTHSKQGQGETELPIIRRIHRIPRQANFL